MKIQTYFYIIKYIHLLYKDLHQLLGNGKRFDLYNLLQIYRSGNDNKTYI